jgi:hypothetical protein
MSTSSEKGKLISFLNGDEYEGQIQNGQRHGKGVYRFSTGAVFEGDFVGKVK